ncbi:hypothetical protein PF327_09320 [Sulfurovum sp. XTW-4]|uniref:Asparagine synthase (Glutamine-hydrolysing) n=1 Tax=Sulfurovum xiamenensis TaxID=3019066 RepID=A0ABT7QV13_9BACT|nr:hypothetical protein [Sulfurovum xiamenensis]MDM5264394.1 hypothetical protein [Sulfurovum xiamenensis]
MMDDLKFRRQFLFTPKRCDGLDTWIVENLDTHYLYVHPDCEFTRVSSEGLDIILLGYILDPSSPEHTNHDILSNLLKITNLEEIPLKLYQLTGRFVLLVKHLDNYRFFHDPCGLRTLFYANEGEDFFAASQPLLLEMVIPIHKISEYDQYFASEYVKNNREHWIPSGISLYENVSSLIPNHYLDTSSPTQVRYWPMRPLCSQPLETSVDIFTELLSKIMISVHKRFKVALPLTAGWDTRVILSACKEIKKDIWFYTLKFRDLTEISNDIEIPTSLASKLGLEYHIIDCKIPLDTDFARVYTENSDIPHLHDWGEMAYAMHKNYPEKYITIKGNCSEIGRCSYTLVTGKQRYQANPDSDLLGYEDEWREIDFIQKGVMQWIDDIKLDEKCMGYDIYDLFYWEHRMGSWQARNQLEFDIVQEAFTPFNSRQLLDIMLRIDPQYRCAPSNLLFKLTMKKLWPEVMTESINPKQVESEIKSLIKAILKKMGLILKR